MKKNRLVILLIVFCTHTYHAATPQEQAHDITRNISSSNSTSVVIMIPERLPPETAHALGKGLNHNPSVFHLLPSPWKLALGATLTCYSTMCGYLLYASYTVEQQSSWAHWRHKVPLAVLQQMDQNQVAQEIYEEIELRYIASKMHCAIMPLFEFIEDIKKETEQLKKFISTHQWLKYIKLHYLFPKQKASLSKALAGIERLYYLQKTVLKWAENYPAETQILPNPTTAGAA